MRPLEITSRIQREHLRELLDLEEPAPRQRTTARMPAVTLSGLLTMRDEEPAAVPKPAPPPEPMPVLLRFHWPEAWRVEHWHLERWPRAAIIAVSFSATLLLLSILSRLL